MLDPEKKYKLAPSIIRPNYIHIPVNYLGVDREAGREFNRIYHYLLSIEDATQIVRTPSGGISIKKHVLKLPAWDVRKISNGVEITAIIEGLMGRFAFKTRPSREEEYNIYPAQALSIFKKTCAKYGIDLEEYAIDNGIEVKETIPSTMKKLYIESVARKIFENVHHIDFHSSFLGGLKRTHPEFAPAVNEIYEGRKEHPENKAVLNLTQGMMQSVKCTRARWAHLVKDMISDNNARLMDVARRLEESGRLVLDFNTDGIWYAGDIYHGEGEGIEAGTWGNDHTNCKWRAKSAASYEYIEDGKYHVVQCGRCKLDDIKPRSEWEWGDIFRKEAKEIEQFRFIPGIGIVEVEDEFTYHEL